MYEDYMQYLGIMPTNTYNDNYMSSYGYLADDLQPMYRQNTQIPYWYQQMTNTSKNDTNLEEMYPDIYNIIYPMVKKACNRCARRITPELIEEMTEEIYLNLESDNIINLNINVENSSIQTSRLSGQNENSPENRAVQNNNCKECEELRNSHHHHRRNNTVWDLIKILLIRELIGNRPPRPPRPSMPPRPPMPRNYEW